MLCTTRFCRDGQRHHPRPRCYLAGAVVVMTAGDAGSCPEDVTYGVKDWRFRKRLERDCYGRARLSWVYIWRPCPLRDTQNTLRTQGARCAAARTQRLRKDCSTFNKKLPFTVPTALEGRTRGGKGVARRSTYLRSSHRTSQRHRDGVHDQMGQAFWWLNASIENGTVGNASPHRTTKRLREWLN